MAEVNLARTPQQWTNIDGSEYVQPIQARAHSGVYTLVYDTVAHYTTLNRTPSASDDGFVVTIPDIELRTTTFRGKKITSFDVIYSIGTSILDDITVAFYRVIPPAHTVAQTAAAIACTYDAAHVNAGGGANGRGIATNHTMTCTVNGGGVWMNVGEGFFVEVAIDADAAATAALKFYGIKLNYTSDEG